MKNKYFISGSIITSLLASICCIGPLILAMLGLTGVAAFSFLEPLRPYLISASVVLFGFAFYFVYRKKAIVNKDDKRRIITSSKKDRLAVWIAFIISIAVIFVPFFESQAADNANNNTNQKGNIVNTNSGKYLNAACTKSCYESLKNGNKKNKKIKP